MSTQHEAAHIYQSLQAANAGEPTTPLQLTVVADPEDGTGASLFWAAWVCLFGVGLALALGGVYLRARLGAPVWWGVAAIGALIVGALLGAARRMGRRA